MTPDQPPKPTSPPLPRHLAAALLCLAASLAAPACAQGSAASGQGARAEGETDAGAGAAAVCANCGTVTAIRESTRRAGPAWKSTISGGGGTGGTSGAGSYQDGRSRMPPPQIGAIGPSGGDSGDAFRRNYGFDVHVLMEDGSRKVVHTESRPALSIGDRVKVTGGQVYLR